MRKRKIWQFVNHFIITKQTRPVFIFFFASAVVIAVTCAFVCFFCFIFEILFFKKFFLHVSEGTGISNCRKARSKLAANTRMLCYSFMSHLLTLVRALSWCQVGNFGMWNGILLRCCYCYRYLCTQNVIAASQYSCHHFCLFLTSHWFFFEGFSFFSTVGLKQKNHKKNR